MRLQNAQFTAQWLIQLMVVEEDWPYPSFKVRCTHEWRGYSLIVLYFSLMW